MKRKRSFCLATGRPREPAGSSSPADAISPSKRATCNPLVVFANALVTSNLLRNSAKVNGTGTPFFGNALPIVPRLASSVAESRLKNLHADATILRLDSSPHGAFVVSRPNGIPGPNRSPPEFGIRAPGRSERAPAEQGRGPCMRPDGSRTDPRACGEEAASSAMPPSRRADTVSGRQGPRAPAPTNPFPMIRHALALHLERRGAGKPVNVHATP